MNNIIQNIKIDFISFFTKKNLLKAFLITFVYIFTSISCEYFLKLPFDILSYILLFILLGFFKEYCNKLLKNEFDLPVLKNNFKLYTKKGIKVFWEFLKSSFKFSLIFLLIFLPFLGYFFFATKSTIFNLFMDFSVYLLLFSIYVFFHYTFPMIYFSDSLSISEIKKIYADKRNFILYLSSALILNTPFYAVFIISALIKAEGFQVNILCDSSFIFAMFINCIIYTRLYKDLKNKFIEGGSI